MQDKPKTCLINKIKADSGSYRGCPKNDYSQNFVATNERPQNFIRDYEEEKRFVDYPKLNDLIKKKNEILKKRCTPPMYKKCDLKTFDLSQLGKFDVIVIDPPWREYEERAKEAGIANDAEFKAWTFEEIANLRINYIADDCCFLFLWCGSREGLAYGRQLLKKWDFRRCEDIVWVKTNKNSMDKQAYLQKESILQQTKEHCLVGIKGAVKRGSDSHFIHSNIDTDVIVSEEPALASTEKPQELYRIIERFCLGRKRIELFGNDNNIRPGWITLGKKLSKSNLDVEKYTNWFVGEGSYPQVQGYEGGRFVGCSVEIENLRPKSPPRQVPMLPMMFPMFNSGFPNGMMPVQREELE